MNNLYDKTRPEKKRTYWTKAQDNGKSIAWKLLKKVTRTFK
jgi:hypothetical protein